MHKPLPSSSFKKDIFKDFPDGYLKQCIDEAFEDLKAHPAEEGETVFKRLRARFERKYGKLLE